MASTGNCQLRKHDNLKDRIARKSTTVQKKVEKSDSLIVSHFGRAQPANVHWSFSLLNHFRLNDREQHFSDFDDGVTARKDEIPGFLS